MSIETHVLSAAHVVPSWHVTLSVWTHPASNTDAISALTTTSVLRFESYNAPPLGIAAYRLLTGRPAVVPGEVPAMLHEVVYRMPPRPSQLADVPILVESVLAIALAQSPDDRFATAGDAGLALRNEQS